jgi:hypothetical protein
MPPLTPRPLASIRTGDVVVLLGSSEHTDGEVIATTSDGRYKVRWATGPDQRMRIGNMNDLRQRSLRPWVPPS